MTRIHIFCKNMLHWPSAVYVDVFRLSGTTDEAIIDDRRQDMNGNREQILLSIWFSETASGISKKIDRKQVL